LRQPAFRGVRAAVSPLLVAACRAKRKHCGHSGEPRSAAGARPMRECPTARWRLFAAVNSALLSFWW
jgi:hypothetical protein